MFKILSKILTVEQHAPTCPHTYVIFHDSPCTDCHRGACHVFNHVCRAEHIRYSAIRQRCDNAYSPRTAVSTAASTLPHFVSRGPARHGRSDVEILSIAARRSNCLHVSLMVGTMMESHVYPYKVCVCDSDHICAYSNRGWTTACPPSALPFVFTRGRAESGCMLGCMRKAVTLPPARGTI